MNSLTSIYWLACLITLVCSMYSNRNDVRGSFLTLLAGCAVFIPIPENLHVAGEILIFALASCIGGRASLFLQIFSTQLIIVHFTGKYFSGYCQDNPYKIAVKVTEYSELLMCLLLSNPVILKIKEKIKCLNTFQL